MYIWHMEFLKSKCHKNPMNMPMADHFYFAFQNLDRLRHHVLHLVQVYVIKVSFNNLTSSFNIRWLSSLLFFFSEKEFQIIFIQQRLSWSWWVILFTNYSQLIRTPLLSVTDFTDKQNCALLCRSAWYGTYYSLRNLFCGTLRICAVERCYLHNLHKRRLLRIDTFHNL